MLPGDLVLAVNGAPVHSVDQFREAIGQRPGQSSEFTVKRGEQTQTLNITPRTDVPRDQGPLGVTLQGRALPIGGLKQKVLAAHAAGLTDVILPERNRQDIDDVPSEARDELAFHPVMSLGEVLDLALEPSRDARSSLSSV